MKRENYLLKELRKTPILDTVRQVGYIELLILLRRIMLDIKTVYDKMSILPERLKNKAFSKVMGIVIPFSAKSKFDIEKLKEGYMRVSIPYIKSNMNHIKTHHALAMSELGELATGVCLAYSLPKNSQVILKSLNTEYLKKGKGKLTVEAEFDLNEIKDRGDAVFDVEIKNKSKETVAKAQYVWHYRINFKK